jgi:mannose-6-phosphate isomerase-like protein (cupin superfamily)
MVYVPRGAVYTATSEDNRPLELLTVYSPPLDPNDVLYEERADRGRENVALTE